MSCPVRCASCDALHNKRDRGSAVPPRLQLSRRCQAGRPSRFWRWNFCAPWRLCRRNVGSRAAGSSHLASAGESQLRVLPNERAPPRHGRRRCLTAKSELPPVIRRAEVVAFALVALLLICVVAVLYVAKAFFLPVVSAFVVGTMLSPAAGLLERHRIPRAVSAVLIVSAVGAGVAFMVGLISSPLMEWSTRLPELGSLLREKLHVFDRPLALWHELQNMVGGSDALSAVRSSCRNSTGSQPTLRIPVADLHRIPAVLRDPGPVHRELARPAARADHDLCRSCRAAANLADPQRNRRSISAAIC